MHKSKSLSIGLEHFARGEYAGAYEAGAKALVDPEAEPVIAHGIVGTSSLYLRERTESPLPEVRRRAQSPQPTQRLMSPKWQDPRNNDHHCGTEVSTKAPVLQPKPAGDSAEIARRQREADKARQQEERMRREAEERGRRRREREASEAAARAAEEARLNREADLRARMRRETEEAEQRRAVRELGDQLKKVTLDRDSAIAEIHSLHTTLVRHRDQADQTTRQLQARNEELSDALEKSQADLHAEKGKYHVEPEELERAKRDLLSCKQTLDRQQNEYDTNKKLLLNERDNAVAQLSPILTQVETLKLEVQRLNNKLSLEKAEYERQLSELTRKHNDERAMWERDFNQIKDANNEREELAKLLATTQDERDACVCDLRSVQRELEDTKKNSNMCDLENKQLCDQNNEVQAQLKFLSADLQAEKDAVQRMKGELGRQQVEHNRRLQDVKGQHDVAVEQQSREMQRLEEDLNRQQMEHSNQLQAVRDDLSSQLVKVTELGKENTELKHQLKDKTTTLDGLQGVGDRVGALEDKLNTQQVQHREEKQALENELNDILQRYNELLSLLEGWKDERLKFDSRTDMLMSKVRRAPSPSPSTLPPSRSSSRMSGSLYSPDKYSLGGPSPRSETAAAL